MKRALNNIIAFTVFVVLVINANLVGVQAQSPCGSVYTVEPLDSMSKIAQMCGVSYRELLAANPDIEDPRLIYPGQTINIPAGGTAGTFIPVTGGSVYIVKPGDSLNRIAGHFSVSSQAITESNPWLAYLEDVYPGMRLTLPSGANQVPTLSITPSTGPQDSIITLAATGFRANTALLIGFGRIAGPFYRVEQVTTDSNGAMMRELRLPDWADETRGDYVFVVQTRDNANIRVVSNYFNLVKPPPDSSLVPIIGQPMVETYVVQPGDTLFEIAQRYRTTLDRLLSLNPSIESAEMVRPGQIIQLPHGTLPAGPYVTISAPWTPPGSELTVRAYNFPRNAFVDILLIPQGARYVQPYDGQTNDQGMLTQTIRIPEEATSGSYIVTVATTERSPGARASSHLFEIRD